MSLASRLKFCAVAVSSTSSLAPLRPRRRRRSNFEDALHVRKPHLYFLALAAGQLEGFGVGEGTYVLAHILVDVARDLAGDGHGAPGLELADRAIVRARPIGENAPLIDDARVRELGPGWADVDVALLVEDEVGAAELAVGFCGLVPHRHVRCDAPIPEPLQELGRAIGGIACKALRTEIEAALDTSRHGLGDGHLVVAISADLSPETSSKNG